MSKMLPAQIAIIKATVPILQSGGEALTKHFYGIMLKDYPVVIPFFNKTHQASGAQPRALANAVLKYAQNIDRLENLGPLVGQIVNKHVSLNIDLDHYPIVGACLLRAIREVLGPEVATDAVIDAWAAAYGQLSNILIGAETAAYNAKAAAPGGWRGDREFVVKQRVKESDEITSFYFEPTDSKPVLSYQPGQYLAVHLSVKGEEVRRNYSISAAPTTAGAPQTQYRISVKRESHGKVSNHLHDHLLEGSRINLFPPAGDFILPTPTTTSTAPAAAVTKPLLLISGGVGITPFVSMVESTLTNESTKNRPVHFIHCTRSPQVQAFRNWIETISVKHDNVKKHFCYSQTTGDVSTAHSGRIDFNVVGGVLAGNSDVDVYFCGPIPFMSTAKALLTEHKVPESQMHWENFGPSSAI